MIAATAPLGAALLRVAQGGLFLGHVGYRLIYIGIPAADAFFVSLGLPSWMAEVVTLLEAIGGVALLLGVVTRISALALAAILLGTIVFVHGQNGFLFTNHNGGWEYPLLWGIALVSQALIGPGRWALRP
jgi:putative oxidoreductase